MSHRALIKESEDEWQRTHTPVYEFESIINARLPEKHKVRLRRRLLRKMRAQCLGRRLVVLEDTLTEFRSERYEIEGIYLRAEPSWVHGLGCIG